jgi:hypothetical protein
VKKRNYLFILGFQKEIKMKVKWTIAKIPNDVELDWFPDNNWSELDRHYEGEIIGVTKSFLGTTYLCVACTDGIIRECEQSEAIIIQDKITNDCP